MGEHADQVGADPNAQAMAVLGLVIYDWPVVPGAVFLERAKRWVLADTRRLDTATINARAIDLWFARAA